MTSLQERDNPSTTTPSQGSSCSGSICGRQNTLVLQLPSSSSDSTSSSTKIIVPYMEMGDDSDGGSQSQEFDMRMTWSLVDALKMEHDRFPEYSKAFSEAMDKFNSSRVEWIKTEAEEDEAEPSSTKSAPRNGEQKDPFFVPQNVFKEYAEFLMEIAEVEEMASMETEGTNKMKDPRVDSSNNDKEDSGMVTEDSTSALEDSKENVNIIDGVDKSKDGDFMESGYGIDWLELSKPNQLSITKHVEGSNSKSRSGVTWDESMAHQGVSFEKTVIKQEQRQEPVLTLNDLLDSSDLSVFGGRRRVTSNQRHFLSSLNQNSFVTTTSQQGGYNSIRRTESSSACSSDRDSGFSSLDTDVKVLSAPLDNWDKEQSPQMTKKAVETVEVKKIAPEEWLMGGHTYARPDDTARPASSKGGNPKKSKGKKSSSKSKAPEGSEGYTGVSFGRNEITYYSYEYVFREGIRRSKEAKNRRVEKPYSCPVPNCDKTYKNANGLKYHAQYGHSPKQEFACEICLKTYGTRHGLNAHKKTHFKKPEVPTVPSLCLVSHS